MNTLSTNNVAGGVSFFMMVFYVILFLTDKND